MTFAGIPAEAFDFYDALVADNSRIFWAAHKPDYESHVRSPMLALGAELEEEFGAGHLYRPYRDLRFSRDPTPYKDHQGYFVAARNGLGWYVQVAVTGLMVAGGWYSATPEQLANYRAWVADDEAGRLQGLLEETAARGLVAGGQRLKTRPRGVAPDHPRLELLRHRTLFVAREWEPQAWMGTPRAVDQVRDQWRAMVPLIDLLAGVVGPWDPRRRG